MSTWPSVDSGSALWTSGSGSDNIICKFRGFHPDGYLKYAVRAFDNGVNQILLGCNVNCHSVDMIIACHLLLY